MVKIFTSQDVFIGEFDGMMTTEQLLSSGVPFSRIRKYVEDGTLIRLQRGIYITKEAMDDEWLLLQMRYKKGIYSGYTALYLHNMTDYIPTEFHMTFPHGYNAKSINENNDYRITPKFVIPKLYGIGLTKVETPYGNTVQTYDRERTLCDIVRGTGADMDIVKQAMKGYVSDRPNIPKLMEYADALNVRPKIHRFMEVLM